MGNRNMRRSVNNFRILHVIGLALKEFKPSDVVLVPEKGTIRKVFAQECKECYKVEDPKRLRFTDIFKLKQVAFLLTLYFFIFLGFNIFYATFPIQAVNGLKWSVTQLGLFYAVLSGIMVLVEGPVLRKASRKFSEEVLIVIGSIILGLNFILFISNQAILNSVTKSVNAGSAITYLVLPRKSMIDLIISLCKSNSSALSQSAIQGLNV
jgi:MFS transporter, DHA1 family, tetracycline resistance protein